MVKKSIMELSIHSNSSQLTFDDTVSDDESISDTEIGLCIPQDRLEDIHFSPYLDGDWIIRLDNTHNIDYNHSSKRDDYIMHDHGEVEEIEPCEIEIHKNDAVYLKKQKYNTCEYPRITKKPRTKTLNMSQRRRRCAHCKAEETPQWRLGPLGPSTLCNACGLMYKVGRLMPNYRPSASPTFDSSKHSNFYKRLMRGSGKKIKHKDDINFKTKDKGDLVLGLFRTSL